MRNIVSYLFMWLLLLSWTVPGYCQNTLELIGEVAEVYTGGGGPGNGLIGGYSLAGLIGGLVFGSIGFVAFIYGKRNSEFKPMIAGVLLMAYPYFVKGTLTLYLIGLLLTAGIFLWRD